MADFTVVRTSRRTLENLHAAGEEWQLQVIKVHTRTLLGEPCTEVRLVASVTSRTREYCVLVACFGWLPGRYTSRLDVLRVELNAIREACGLAYDLEKQPERDLAARLERLKAKVEVC